MASLESTLNTLIPSKTKSFYAIFEQSTYLQLFKNAKILDVIVEEDSRNAEHTVETGSIITDDSILLPISFKIPVMLNTTDLESIYASIRQYFINKTFLLVQTRTAIYGNQTITSMPHIESGEIFGSAIVTLSFREWQVVTPQYNVVPENPSNSSTVDRGIIQGEAANDAQTEDASGSYLAYLSDKAGLSI